MLSQKIRKMGPAKKHCKTQDILMVGGLSWGYVGLSWRQCRPIFGLCWPILGLCWPILGLCWPILGAMLPHLGAMLAHVDPSWATRSEKWEKMGRARNTVKRGGFWPDGVGRRLGRRPLSPTDGKHLKPGQCLTLLSEATRKPLLKRPADGQRLQKAPARAPGSM